MLEHRASDARGPILAQQPSKSGVVLNCLVKVAKRRADDTNGGK